jgi:hypothetical protein
MCKWVSFPSRLLALAALLLWAGAATAQVVPVATTVSSNVATVQVGTPAQPLAEVTLTFDDASGLSPSSLGVSARLVDLTDPGLLTRLPGSLLQLDRGFPLLVTIEPPANAGLSFHRTVRVEVHTHALVYAPGSSYRLFKAPLNGSFRDITDEIAPGSVRARGTTGGFSQFLVLTDLRETDSVIAAKTAWLRNRIEALPAAEQSAFDALLDTFQSALASGAYADALVALDAFRARAADRAGTALTDQWRATRDGDNQAGELMAGAATLKFSAAYLRDYGR